MPNEHITFQTTDGVTIVGTWNLPQNAKKAVLLLHMMPATKKSYEPLADELNKTGVATLAIDLRGHGESTTQGTAKLNYQKFSDSQHQSSRLDIDAALNFLKGKGFAEENIILVGASIGANLAIDAMYRYTNILRGVLLSPGLDYRGVQTESPMKQLAKSQKTWFVAAEEDKYSADSVLTLQQLQRDTATLTIFSGSDHGTNLFNSQPALIPNIVKFLLS